MTLLANPVANVGAAKRAPFVSLAVAAVLAGAFALQANLETNTDVSWLLTLCERWLAGDSTLR